jgi:hypothetical protein
MKWLKLLLLAGALLTADMLTLDFVVRDAEARVGRPATPASVAGVARRTTRRMVRRTAVYATTLPAGCQTILVEGTTLYQCGGTYYQASGSQYEVVQIQ